MAARKGRRIKNRIGPVYVFLAAAVFFIPFAAGIFHAHDDCLCHDDCPVCNWLVQPLFVFVAYLFFSGLLRIASESFPAILPYISAGPHDASPKPRSPPSYAGL